MTTIHVSPEFPLNRRMRKAVRRGKLRVVREGGKRLSLGGGMAIEARRAVRTVSSPLVCMAEGLGKIGGATVFSSKTRHSIAQLLGVLPNDTANLLLSKHQIIASSDESCLSVMDTLKRLQSQKGSVRDLVHEIGITRDAVRREVTPRYIFDNRFSDLENCLKLDGFRFRTEPGDDPQDGG